MQNTSTNNEEKQPLLVSNSYTVDIANRSYDFTNQNHSDGRDKELSIKDQQTEDFSFKRLTHRSKLILVVVAMVNFCAYTCFSLLAPFFPREAKLKGASQTVVGLIFSCFEFWIFVSSPLFGYFITRIGAKFMFISGVMVCGCCSILFGVLDKSPPGTVFIVMCFVCRTVEALGTSAFITAGFAIVALEFPNNIATVFGSLETFIGIGLMIGPPIGGALYQLGGYGLPFWTLGSVLLTCGFVSFIIMPPQTESRKPFKGSVLHLLKSPLVGVVCCVIFSGSFSLGFLDPTLASHLEPYNLNALYVGLVFVCAPGVYGLTAPFYGCLGDKKEWSGILMFIGCIAAAVAFFCLGPAPFLNFLPSALWLNIVSLCVLGLTLGCTLIPTFKLILTGARHLGLEESLDTYGMVSGLFNSVFSLGAFAGPSLGGYFNENYGFEWASTACAFLYIFGGLVILLYGLTSKVGFKTH